MCTQTTSPGIEHKEGELVEPLWQKKNEEVTEQEFQKDLEVITHSRTCTYSTCVCVCMC